MTVTKQDGTTLGENATLGKREVYTYYGDGDGGYTMYGDIWTGERIEAVAFAGKMNYSVYKAEDLTHCTIDATPEAYAAAREFIYNTNLTTLRDAAVMKAGIVDLGRQVEVTRGRKVKPGTQGVVFWHKEVAKYGGYGTEWRAGIKDAQGEVHWVPAWYLRVIDPENYLPNDADLRAQAREVADAAYSMVAPARAAVRADKVLRALDVVA